MIAVVASLQGELVRLRPLRREDAPRLAEIGSHPEVARWWPDITVEELVAKAEGRDEVEAFAIEHDGELVGLGQIYEHSNPEFRHAGIDLFLDPRLRALGGFVRQAARTILALREHEAVAVEDVVDDLEEHPELVREVAPRLLLPLRQLRGPERTGDRRVEEAPGLQSVDLLEGVVELLRVSVLAADHAERRLDELPRDERRRVRERETDRFGKQGVARENPRRLVELCPRARPPAAHFVVVERGQVVVHEREAVDELDCRARWKQLVGVAPERLAGCERQDRPDPLAAAGERVAHRLGELTELRRQCELVEVGLDPLDELGRALHPPASFFARASSASTSRAISASSERISIARSGSWVDSSSCRERSSRSSRLSARCSDSSAPELTQPAPSRSVRESRSPAVLPLQSRTALRV